MDSYLGQKDIGIRRVFCVLLNLIVCGRHGTVSSVLLLLSHCCIVICGLVSAAPRIAAAKKLNWAGAFM